MHPVTDLLTVQAAGGRMPSDAEVAALGLPAGLPARLQATARKVVDLRRAGENGAARETAREEADAIVAELPETWSPASPMPLPDPAALAADVRRW